MVLIAEVTLVIELILLEYGAVSELSSKYIENLIAG